jgi:hypothetical protein
VIPAVQEVLRDRILGIERGGCKQTPCEQDHSSRRAA